MAKVYVDSSRSAFAGIAPSEFLENLAYRRAEKRWCGVLGDNPPRGEFAALLTWTSNRGSQERVTLF